MGLRPLRKKTTDLQTDLSTLRLINAGILDCWCRLPFDDDGSTVDGDTAFVFSSPVKNNVVLCLMADGYRFSVSWKAAAKLSFCAVATNSYLGFV